jgi:hypothetical protein
MIKSQFKFFPGIFTLGLLSLIFLSGFVIPVLLIHPNKPDSFTGNPASFVIVPIILSSVLIYIVQKNMHQVHITEDKIIFKNIVTRKRSEYLFSELDGYVHHPDLKRNETIHIIQRNQKMKHISTHFYQNFDEIKKEVSKHLRLIDRKHLDLF